MHVTKQLMDCARGTRQIDLVLRRANLVNVLAGEIHTTDIGIHAGKFMGIGRFDQAVQEIDLDGQYVVPGLIDAHVHIESSHLCPEEFVSVLLAHGVTSAVIDPHEIANVLGLKGIEYMLQSLAKLPFNPFIALPSCVPATELETSGARLDAAALGRFVQNPLVIALGEVMNFPGVLKADPSLLAKLEMPLAVKDGHAPGAVAQDLNALFLAGITTDHECSSPQEAVDRVRRGFYVMLREGSAAQNLLDIVPAVNAENARQFLLVTDDRQPAELLSQGSIDHLVRLAIQAGQPPVRVIQMASLNAARAYGLNNLGAVAPGYWADFSVVSDLQRFTIEQVYWHGNLQSSQGRRPVFSRASTHGLTTSVTIGNPEALNFTLQAGTDKSKVRVQVIGVQGRSLVTQSLIRELPVVDGRVMPDEAQQIAKLVVVERHGKGGHTAIGFVTGLGPFRGAIASTVAHDSHNLIALGMCDKDIDLAVRTCARIGGGICVVKSGQVLGQLPLPIAGLMTDRPAEQVQADLIRLHAQARNLGISKAVDPFMTLAFLSLPVIPELKLTDLGLVDVNQQRIISPLID